MTPSKLSEFDKQVIVDLYRRSSETTASLAERYGVSTSTVSRVLRNALNSGEYETLLQQKRQERFQGRSDENELGVPDSLSPLPKYSTDLPSEQDVYEQELPILSEKLLSEKQREQAPHRSPVMSFHSTSSLELAHDDEQLELLNRHSQDAVALSKELPIELPIESFTETRPLKPSTPTPKSELSRPKLVKKLHRSSEPLKDWVDPDVNPDQDILPDPSRVVLKQDIEFRTVVRTNTDLSDLDNSRPKGSGLDSSHLDTLDLDVADLDEDDLDDRDLDSDLDNALESDLDNDDLDDNDLDNELDDEDLDDEDLDDFEEDDDFIDEEDDGSPFGSERLESAGIVQILPLSSAQVPRVCYLVVDRAAELVTHPLAVFRELGEVPLEEESAKTLPVFDNHRVAKRFSKHNQRIIKVPDGRILQKASPYLQAKGITRLLIDGQVYAL